MGNKGVVSLVVLMLFVAAPAFSTETATPNETVKMEGVTAGANASHLNDAAAHVHWDFITCVCDAHECEHEADHHGYDHYKVTHNHRLCGHDDLACYGGHH